MTTKILVLASNPKGTEQLKLNPEIRLIQDALQEGNQRENFSLESILEANLDDLQKTIRRKKPQIVHFCGHGTGSQGLVLATSSGQIQLLDTQAIADLFKLFNTQVKCVVLNACNSQFQAAAINQHINYVVKTKQEIRDDAAVAFSKGFYEALFDGETIERAYEFGCNRIQIEIYGSSKRDRKLIPIDSEEEYKYIELPQHEVIQLLIKEPLNVIVENGTGKNPKRRCQVFQAPPLPSHFVDRPEISQNLKKRLIEDSTNHSGTLVISAIQGLGGIGKTILTQALAHEPQVQERFGDGILWATLGQQPDVLSLLQDWIIALKDYDYKPTTVKAASSHLNSLLYDKAVLLVIDDGWKVEDIEPFRVGSDQCQAIVTTRLANVAEEINAQLYSLDLMSESQSLMLLSNRLGRELEEDERQEARQLAEAVGYLPIALDLAAARVAREKSWSELNSALTAEIAQIEVLEGIRRRSKKETRLEASFNLSLNFLREYFPEAWNSFVWLGVLPEDVSIAAPMVATLWKVDITEAADRLELFWNDALLLPGVPVKIGAKEWKTYRIHDLLHDLAINWLTEENSPGLRLTITKAHNILLERYQNHLDGGKWHQLTDDGYIVDHLTWHMEKAECADSIHQLLQEETKSKQNGWHSKCDSLGKPAIFVQDVARAWRLAEAEYETNPSRAIGLQCRYALITSSLNTIAGNIPPELIAVLLEKKVWTSTQGLAYARQVQSISQRVQSLSKLALYFPEIWLEALSAARSIGNEKYRADVLSSLAPHLPENLLSETLSALRSIGSESERARLFHSLAPNVHKMFGSESYDFWCEVIHSLASLKRRELLNKIANHNNIIKELGSSETFREIADAIIDVGRWFP